MKAVHGKLDEEVIDLCNALNSIQGVRTDGSCSGHGKQPLRIWFAIPKTYKLPRGFHTVARAIDRRYGGPSNWTLQVEDLDLKERMFSIFLESTGAVGKEAYDQAKIIIRNIEDDLRNKNYTKGFKIKRSDKYLDKDEKMSRKLERKGW